MYRRHDLHTGFGTERENLVPDAKENDKWPTADSTLTRTPIPRTSGQ